MAFGDSASAVRPGAIGHRFNFLLLRGSCHTDTEEGEEGGSPS